MYKDVTRVGKRILAVILSLCMVLGLTDFSALTVKAAGRTEMQATDVTLSATRSVYNGEEQKPTVTVKIDDGAPLVENTDYTVDYGTGNWTDAGDYTVTVTPDGTNYTGTPIEKNVKIVPQQIDSSDVMVTVAPQKITGNGNPVKLELGEQGLWVRFRDQEITGKLASEYVPDTDTDVAFIYEYAEYTAATAAAVVKITGVNNFQGTKKQTFTIVNKSLETDVDITCAAEVVYDKSTTSYVPKITITEKNDPDTELVLNTDYKVSYEGDNTRPGKVTAVISGWGDYAGSEVRKEYNITKNIQTYALDITTSLIPEQVYTGSAIQIENLIVYDEARRLTEGQDYTLEYLSNTESGTAMIFIVGKGSYKGEVEKNFEIVPGDISRSEIPVPKNIVFTGTAQRPKPEVSYNKKVMPESEYTVSYEENINAGDGFFTVRGNGKNLVNEQTVQFEIAPKSLTADDNTISIQVIEGALNYDGTEKTPKVSITYTPEPGRQITLLEKQDYTLTYSNNTVAGVNKATVIISGIGNYTGRYTKTFTINPADISTYTVSGIQNEITYTGAAITFAGITVTSGNKTLGNGTDYDITYENNTDVGQATVTITGKNNYQGTISRQFKINQKSLAEDNNNVFYELGYDSTPYAFTAREPKVTVTHRVNGKPVVLEEVRDYSVRYENNTEHGTATVYIEGVGNFEGIHTQTFTITPMVLSANDKDFILEFPAAEYVHDGKEYFAYNGNACVFQSPLTLKNGNHVLGFGTDYEISYADNTAPGKGVITVTGKEGSNFTGSITRNFQIKGDLAFSIHTTISEIADQVYTGNEIVLDNSDIEMMFQPTDTTLELGKDFEFAEYSDNTEIGSATVKIVAEESGNYYTSGDIYKTFTIVPKDLDDESIPGQTDGILLEVKQIPNQSYTGSAIVPELTVRYNGRELIQGTDYQIVPQAEGVNNTVPGEASITIAGMPGSHFAGMRTIPFTIVKRDISKGQVTVEHLDAERIYQGTPVEIEGLSFSYVEDPSDANSFSLSSNEMVLGEDYEVSYQNNDFVGTATVTITGIGEYFEGEVTREFLIKGDLSDSEHTVVNVKNHKVYIGSPVELTDEDIEITYYGELLKFGIEYELDYSASDNINAADNVAFTVKSLDTDKYINETSGEFVIDKKPLSDTDGAVSEFMQVNLDEDGYDYNMGQNVEARPEVIYGLLPDGANPLTEVTEANPDGDYTLSWNNATDVVDWEMAAEAEKPSVTVTAAENGNYTGSVTVPFKINPLTVDTELLVAKDGQELVEGYTVAYAGSPITFEDLKMFYNGQELIPGLAGSDSEEPDVEGPDVEGPDVEVPGVEAADGEIPEKFDYTISYEVDTDSNEVWDNDEVGTATLVVTGHGNYTGTKEFHFLITGDLSLIQTPEEPQNPTVVEPIEPYPYTMGGSEPKVTVSYFGQVLAEGKDYELSYENNENVAREDSENPPTVIITGKGGFTGTETRKPFEIVVRDLSEHPQGMTLEGLKAEGYSFTGEEIKPGELSRLVLKNNGFVVDPSQYTISYENNINGGKADSENPPYVVISGTYTGEEGSGNYTGSMKVPFTIVGTPLTSAGIKIEAPEAQTYTGEALEPKVTVTHGERVLIEGEEYTLSWENNIIAGRANGGVKAPVVVIEGIGNYSAEVKRTFDINPRSMDTYKDEFEVTVAPQDYTGEALTPEILVTRNGVELEAGMDYETVTAKDYTDNVNAGTAAAVTIKGKGNYTDTYTQNFTILPQTLEDETVAISDVEEKTYNTKPQAQTPTVTWGEVALTEEDYILSYENNVDAGTAAMIVTGQGNFTGTQRVEFTIVPHTLSQDEEFILVEEIPAPTYTGAPATPVPTITWQDDTEEISYTLVNNQDYTLTYRDNTLVGTDVATAVITGTGNFAGTLEKKFTIKGNVALASISAVGAQNYTGKAIEPKLTIKEAGRTLVEGTDYTLAYSNNVEPGKAAITITGIGNDFGGSKVVDFNIVRDISASITIVGLASSYLYSGTEIRPTLGKVSVGNQVLRANTDYKITYSNNIDEGTAIMTIVGAGYYKGVKSYNFRITRRSIAQCSVNEIPEQTYTGNSLKPAVTIKYGSVILREGKDYQLVHLNNNLPGKAGIVINGRGNYKGSKLVNFDIKLEGTTGLKAAPAGDGKVKLSWAKNSKVTGYQILDKENKVVAKVKGSGKTSYTVSGLKAGSTRNYKVRTYLIRGGRTYYSSATKLIKVITQPTVPKITVKSKKSKQALVSWKKPAGVSGYEIYRSVKAKDGYSKVATTSRTSYTNKNLSGGKKYYYKVRAYKNVSGKKIYSSFSSVKHVTIKK